MPVLFAIGLLMFDDQKNRAPEFVVRLLSVVIGYVCIYVCDPSVR